MLNDVYVISSNGMVCVTRKFITSDGILVVIMLFGYYRRHVKSVLMKYKCDV